jgi:hypothetical protein
VAQRRLAPGPCGDVATAGRENASLLRCYCVANVLLKCCGDVATAGRENPGTHHGPYRQQASLKKPLPVFRYHVKPLPVFRYHVKPLPVFRYHVKPLPVFRYHVKPLHADF